LSTQTSPSTLKLEYVKTIGIVNNGYNGRGFANPYDITISKDGRIFVLNRCDPARAAAIRVGVCTLDDKYLFEFGNGYGQGDGEFVWPVAMAFDSAEKLFITDEYTNRVSIFDNSGAFLGKWGEPGSEPGQLNGPAGIAIDPQDNVYLVDQHNSRVQKFTADGKYITHWGTAGKGEGQFNLPWGVALDLQGNVYVADWRNDRIQKFTSSGEFIAVIGETGAGDGQFSRPSGVTVDEDGFIYVADWGNERIQVLDSEGRFVLKLRGEATVSKWAEDYYGSNPEELETRNMSNLTPKLPEEYRTPYQISSQSEPYFWGPVSVKLDKQGRLYVPETNRHRFQVYQKKA
jgi:DNA-binding beta-propeller fold protein YncE